MAEPMPPKRRVSLTEILTIDDLINLVSSKAHTRRGRVVVGASSLVLLAAIIFAPIIIRSNQSGAGPSSNPTIPVVTVPPSTNARTAFVDSPVGAEIDTSSLHDRNRYGEAPGTVAPKATAAPPTTAAPPITPAPTLPQATVPATVPATYPQVTYPLVTSPPATTPPLTIPPANGGGIWTPG